MRKAKVQVGPPAATAEELLAIIRTLPDVVFRCVKDDQGRIVWTMNEGRLAEEFHLTTKEVHGKSLEEMFPPEVAAAQKPYFERAFRGEAVEWVHELGGRLFKHFPQPVRDGSGRVVAVVGFITEVTGIVQAQKRAEDLNRELIRRLEELRAANRGLEQANRDLDGFSSSVAHDVRTPLSVISNLVFVLRGRLDGSLDGKSREDLEAIARATRRMADLTADLLAFSRAAQQPLKQQAVDLSLLAWQVAKVLEAQEPRRDVEWRIPDGLRGWGDPGLVRIVLENLLGNAWKYTSREAQATILLRQAGSEEGRPVFSVQDNGVGFDPGQAEGLFQAYRRLPGSEAFPGTGMGLATVRRIVERHGGRVWAEGRPSQGAQVRFTLGRAPAAVAGAAVPAA